MVTWHLHKSFMRLFVSSFLCSFIIQELIVTFTLEEIQQLLLSVAERNSGMLLDLLRAPPAPEHPPQPPEQLVPGWCVCTHCRPMRRDVELVCCGLQPANCISLTEVRKHYSYMELNMNYVPDKYISILSVYIWHWCILLPGRYAK